MAGAASPAPALHAATVAVANVAILGANAAVAGAAAAYAQMHHSDVAAVLALGANRPAMRQYYDAQNPVPPALVTAARGAAQQLDGAAGQAVNDARAAQVAANQAVTAAQQALAARASLQASVNDLKADRTARQDAYGRLDGATGAKRKLGSEIDSKESEIREQSMVLPAELDKAIAKTEAEVRRQKKAAQMQRDRAAELESQLQQLQLEINTLTATEQEDRGKSADHYEKEQTRAILTQKGALDARVSELGKRLATHDPQALVRASEALQNADREVGLKQMELFIHQMEAAAAAARESMQWVALNSVLGCNRRRAMSAPAAFHPPPDIQSALRARTQAAQACNQARLEEDQAAAARREMDRLKLDLEQQYPGGWLVGLKSSIQAVVAEAKGRLDRLRKLLDQLQKAKSERDSKVQNATLADTHAQNLESTIQTLKAQKSAALAAVPALQGELAILQTQMLTADANLQAATQAVAAKDKEIADAESLLAQLQQAATFAQAEANRIREEMDSAFRSAADCYEAADDGHSVYHHGVALDQDLIERVTTGYFRAKFSPATTASVFNNYQAWIGTREANLARGHGIHLTNPSVHPLGRSITGDPASPNKPLKKKDGTPATYQGSNQQVLARTHTLAPVHCYRARSNIQHDLNLNRNRVVQHIPEP